MGFPLNLKLKRYFQLTKLWPKRLNGNAIVKSYTDMPKICVCNLINLLNLFHMQGTFSNIFSKRLIPYLETITAKTWRVMIYTAFDENKQHVFIPLIPGHTLRITHPTLLAECPSTYFLAFGGISGGIARIKCWVFFMTSWWVKLYYFVVCFSCCRHGCYCRLFVCFSISMFFDKVSNFRGSVS